MFFLISKNQQGCHYQAIEKPSGKTEEVYKSSYVSRNYHYKGYDTL